MLRAYDVLKIRDYRWLLASRLFVTVALQIQGLAVGWQVYALTKDPLALGMIGLSEAVPSLLISLYAGHLADIVDRKRLAQWSVVTMALCLAMLGMCSKTMADSRLFLVFIFALIAMSGLSRGFYVPAVFGLVSQMVPRELYGNASAWNTAIWQASAILGPVLGGYLYLQGNASITYTVATILLLVALCGFMQVKTEYEGSSNGGSDPLKNISEGLYFVFSNQILLGAMALDLFAVLFGGAVAVLPMFVSDIFHCGPQALGLLRAAPCIGALVTASILTHWPVSANAGKWLLLSVAGFGICMVGFGLSTSLWLSICLLILSGALDGISIYVRSTISQLCTPHDMKGRVASVNSIFIGSSNEIGQFESGVAARVMGLVPSVVFGGCMTLVVVLLTAMRAPKLRNMHIYALEKEVPQSN